MTSCQHISGVIQQSDIPPIQYPAKCKDCEMGGNLWCCLVCGNLACGRKQFGGGGGNGHGLDHFEKTGHQVCVKLGTITPEGTADIFCYACGDERIDPHLAIHLAKIGIADQEPRRSWRVESKIFVGDLETWTWTLVIGR
jgi:ubiquitin carboxyl-terminal hydrolase 5/13